MSRTIEYRVTVHVKEGPWCDEHDHAIVAAALEDAVEALGWEGVEAAAERL